MYYHWVYVKEYDLEAVKNLAKKALEKFAQNPEGEPEPIMHDDDRFFWED